MLKTPVRLTPWPDGNPCHSAPVEYLSDVIAHLEQVYGGERVVRYMNPEHEAVHVEVVTGAAPQSLRDLADYRAKGGRSKSPAKQAAARENLARTNETRAEQTSEEEGWWLCALAG